MLAVEAHDGRVFLHDDRGKFQEVLVNEPVIEVTITRLSERRLLAMEHLDDGHSYINLRAHNRSLGQETTGRQCHGPQNIRDFILHMDKES